MTAPNYGNPAGDGPLRIDGVSATGIPSRDADLPSTWSDAAKKQQHALKIVRDLEGGTETVRAETTAYLPQAPGEDASNYKHRLARSVFFNAFQNTVEGLTGFVFAKDPVLGDDVPVQIAGTETQPGHWENIDLAGTHGDVFLRAIFQDALAAGHAAILVDYPTTDGTQDLRQEQTGEIRPYWVPIKKDNIVSWRTVLVNGQTVLTQLVLREIKMVPDGAYGEKEQTQYRVFKWDAQKVTVEVLEVTDKKEVRQVSTGSYPTQIEIPVAEIKTSGRCDLFESKPPLLDLAYLNIAHYQQWSDRAYSIHKTCVPIYVETGVDTTDDSASPIVIGPNSARRFSNSDADAKYVTHDGAALGEVRSAIEELKSDMAVLGLAMLAPQKRVAETADAKRIDKAASDSKLGVSARGLQDGAERALAFHGRYLKGQPDGGSIQINRDFENNVMDAPMMTAIADFCVKLDIPVRMALEALKRGNSPLISDSDNLDEIEREIMANQAAKAAQAADEAALLAAQNKPPVPQAA